MNALALPYSSLKTEILVAILQLADLLKTTPKRALEIYLAEQASPPKAKA
jgi:hypothetical protein